MKELLQRVTHYVFNGIMTILIMASPIIALVYASPEPVTITQRYTLNEYWDSFLSVNKQETHVAFEVDDNKQEFEKYHFKDKTDETNLSSEK